MSPANRCANGARSRRHLHEIAIGLVLLDVARVIHVPLDSRSRIMSPGLDTTPRGVRHPGRAGFHSVVTDHGMRRQAIGQIGDRLDLQERWLESSWRSRLPPVERRCEGRPI